MELKKDIKCKIPVLIMLIFSTILIYLSHIVFLLGSAEYYFQVDNVFGLGSCILYVISGLIEFTPCLLLILFMTAFYKKEKSTIYMFASFGLYVVELLLIAITNILSDISYYTSSDDFTKRFIKDQMASSLIENFLYYLIFSIPYILFAISVYKGINNKVLPIIGSVIGILLETFLIYNNVSNYVIIELEIDFQLLTTILGNVGYILLFVTILIFGLKNTIPSLSKKPSKVKKVKTYNAFPQQPYAGNYYTASQQPYARNAQGYYTAPQQPYVGNGQGYYTAPQQPYVGNGQGYYTAPQQPYTGNGQGYYTAPQQPYTGNAQGYYTAPQQPYAGNGQGYYTDSQQPHAGN